MPRLDLYSNSPNPSPEQLIEVCDHFLKLFRDGDWKIAVESAEHLAEQILGHYHSLPAVSQETAGLSRIGEKLPHQVFYVFLYACVRDHSATGQVMEELEALYSDGEDHRARASMLGLWQNVDLVFVPRPKLWNSEGKLKYSPSAFVQMHENALYHQIIDYWKVGVPGVQKILSDYPLMNEPSRQLIDSHLCRLVYERAESEDHPMRVLLADKLDAAEDCQMRLKTLIQGIDYVSDQLFDERFRFAFSLVQSLPEDKRSLAFKGIDDCINTAMSAEVVEEGEDDATLLEEPQMSVRRLVKILEAAQGSGYSPLPKFHSNYRSSLEGFSDRDMMQVLLNGGFSPERKKMDVVTAWVEAAMIAADEAFLLSFDLNEKLLAQLSSKKGTPGLRKALLATNTGRDIALGQDLGL